MADCDPVRRRQHASKGGLAKYQNELDRRKRFAAHADYIRRLVDEAPPLSELQRARLAALLLGARREPAAPRPGSPDGQVA